MKQGFRKLSRLILLLPSLLLTACNDKTIPVTSISIDQGEELNVKLRDEVYLTATMSPNDTTELYYHFVNKDNHLPRYFEFNQDTCQFFTTQIGSFTLKAYPGYAYSSLGLEYYDNHPYDSITINVSVDETVEDIFVDDDLTDEVKSFLLLDGEYRWFKFTAPNTGTFRFTGVCDVPIVLDLFDNANVTGNDTTGRIASYTLPFRFSFTDMVFEKGEQIYIRIKKAAFDSHNQDVDLRIERID